MSCVSLCVICTRYVYSFSLFCVCLIRSWNDIKSIETNNTKYIDERWYCMHTIQYEESSEARKIFELQASRAACFTEIEWCANEILFDFDTLSSGLKHTTYLNVLQKTKINLINDNGNTSWNIENITSTSKTKTGSETISERMSKNIHSPDRIYLTESVYHSNGTKKLWWIKIQVQNIINQRKAGINFHVRSSWIF